MEKYPDFLVKSLKELNYKEPSPIQLKMYELFSSPEERRNIIA